MSENPEAVQPPAPTPPPAVKPKRQRKVRADFRSVRPRFSTRVADPANEDVIKGEKGDGMLHFTSNKMTTLTDPYHIRLCEGLVPRILTHDPPVEPEPRKRGG